MLSTTMLAEIREQPTAVARTLDALLPLRAELRRLAEGRRQVLFMGRGSSDHACVYGRYLVEAHAHRQSALAAPSVLTHYDARLDLSDSVMVSVSQSGRTEEIVCAQRRATALGARTVAVTNQAASPLAAEADLALVTMAGDERAVPATKTYTTQLAAVAVLGTALADDPGSLDGELARVPEELGRLVEPQDDLDAAVELLADAGSTLVSGRGFAMGSALELALKLEETCLRPVRGLSYADLRHGPIAIVDGDLVPVLLAAPEGPMLGAMTGLATDLAARGARGTVGIGGDDAFARACDVALDGPRLDERIAPLALAAPGQVVVEALARRLGLDPDAPRGLNKVTQTD